MDFAELWAGASAEAARAIAMVLSSPTQLSAHLAAALGITLVVAGAFARTMLPLRWLAVGSNAGMLVYGALHPSPITLTVAAALLPINLYRAVEVTRLTRRVHRAGVASTMAALWLRPYMKPRKLKAGQVLFHAGDAASRLYMLAQGSLELAATGQALAIGEIFGEIGLFSPERVRTQTVRAIGPCTVLEIDERTVKQLYFQSPAFGFHLIELLAQRLGADVSRARQTASGSDPG